MNFGCRKLVQLISFPSCDESRCYFHHQVAEPRARRSAADAVVGSVPVVEVIPERQGSAAVIGVEVGASVRPFPQGRLDEALGLAVGLGVVGAAELLVELQATRKAWDRKAEPLLVITRSMRMPGPTQHPADRRLEDVDVRGDAGLKEELAVQLHDRQRRGGIAGTR